MLLCHILDGTDSTQPVIPIDLDTQLEILDCQ